MSVTLESWASNRWLRAHTTSREEVEGLFSIVERDLKDAARRDVSADWRFGIAYNAALKLCAILLRASGYRAERNLEHYRTIAALPFILGEARREDAAYLETCRVKRNIVEYDTAGAATHADADELLAFCSDLRVEVIGWLKSRRPNLIPVGL